MASRRWSAHASTTPVQSGYRGAGAEARWLEPLSPAQPSDPATQDTKVLIFSHLHAEERAREAGADAF